jgi:hypothetical protein
MLQAGRSLAMSFLDSPEPRRRLAVEMDIVARNLTHLTKRYRVLPQGRSSLVIPGQDSDLVLGSGKWATAPYKENLGGCQIMRTRLRTPGMTVATADMAFAVEGEDPWAWQSGIADATDAMVTWILLEELHNRRVSYQSGHRRLVSDGRKKPLASFIGEGLAQNCYPTEAYFAQDVCTYLSRWWTVESEVDGVIDGDEVRIDAILTHREQPGAVVGVEFKNPQTHSNALRGLTQAAKYRKADWQGHGRLPIAYCCPGKVPSGREALFVIRTLHVGVLDFTGRWSLAMEDFSWSEQAGLSARKIPAQPPHSGAFCE